MAKSRSEIIGFCNFIAITFFILMIIGLCLNEYFVSLICNIITLTALSIRLHYLFVRKKNAKKKKDN